jgi:hypothetical protein
MGEDSQVRTRGKPIFSYREELMIRRISRESMRLAEFG